MKSISLLAIPALMIAGIANAGSYNAPVIEGPVAAPAYGSIGTANNWSGFYAGAQVSYADFSLNLDGVDNATGGVYGLHAGYNHQMPSNMIVGAEVTFDHSSADTDVWQVERLMSVRAKLGYGGDRWMAYGLAGYAHVRTEGASRSHGKSGGAVLGVGADYAVTEKVLVGGTWEAYNFDDFKNDVDDLEVDGGAVKFRVSYKF